MKITPRPFHLRLRLLMPLALALGCALQLTAITDSDFEGAVNYDFRPPGARSLAMGGAFTALSDDATAVLVNPAGLAQLRKKEFSFVAKSWGEDMHLEWGSGAVVDLSSTFPGFPLAFREDRDFWTTRAGPAFVSYVMPFKRFAVSVFAAQLANTNNGFVRDTVVVGPYDVELCPPIFPTCQRVVAGGLSLYQTVGEGRMRLQRFGVSGSFALNNKLSIGATVYMGRMKFNAVSTRYTRVPYISPSATVLTVTETGNDKDISGALGVHYHGKVWNFGASYQRGERFTIHVDPQPGPANPFVTFIAAPFNTYLRVPDRLTLGASVRPTPLLTISFEMENILWSQVATDITSFHPQEIDPKYRMANSYNPHLGAEYVVLADTSPLTLRAGIWLEKGHMLQYTGHSPDTVIPIIPGVVTQIIPGSTVDNGQHVLFPGGGSQQHFTAGIGYVVGRLQFDAGYDYSKWNRQFALSTVFRFR